LPELILLASGLLIPLLAFAFARFSRDDIPLMVRLLAGTGVACGMLAWLPKLGDVESVAIGSVSYGYLSFLAATSSLIAGAPRRFPFHDVLEHITRSGEVQQ
jgi:hypothetical protein